MYDIDLKKLTDTIESKQSITEDELLVRELINLCSDFKNVSLEDIDKFSARHFLIAYKSIVTLDCNEDFIDDMIGGEYLKDNLKSIEIFDDEEDEIY
ncbi:hypothetical protein [Clostridium baratii]|uniref:hypothetical protein n=1 Tax=Clostridium baratii TaxID=1561 RepID=UPI0005F2D9BF|nr:hypothetical protein [Clostridium baratii]AQM58568.1 hypothetical protein NPD11_3039 [Clostridium baratii]KJU71555.1 hypothetical protein UC77_09075 [Clostridium baratii]